MVLTAEEARVLGSLVEKELTTPDQYPLTLNALVAASNQASNRDPVVAYDDGTVMEALDSLKAQRLIRFVLPSHGRTVVRYRHVLNEALGLDTRQCALLAVLLLLGPQTVGELRARTERMTSFDGLDEVEHELRFLSATAEPLATSLGRRPGQKEERWTSPLVAPAGTVTPTAAALPATLAAPDVGPDVTVGDLQAQIGTLRSEVAELRRDLDALRTSLGG
jgi:uncharacterized protein YceH (UPF0502 family)